MTAPLCLVTGATSGIGFATAQRLAARGATTIVVGRTPGKAEAAAASIRAATGSDTVEWLAAELADEHQVRTMAAEVERRHSRLDVLVNNAGSIIPRHQSTPDGVELTFAVNHLAPFLLTNLLLPLLRSSAPSRVLTLASAAHERGRIDLDDLRGGGRGYLPFRAYARSKLANVLFTYELARRLDGTGVTANAVDPGLVRTRLGRGNGLVRDLAWHVTHLRHRDVETTPDEAAGVLERLATAPELGSVTGTYFVQGRPATSSAPSRDRAAAEALWRVSEELTHLRPADAVPTGAGPG